MSTNKKKRTSEILSDFLAFLRDISLLNDFETTNMKHCDDMTQDILHQLELGNDLYKERAKIATQLKLIRQKRRISKDILEEISPIIEWTNKNKGAINDLTNVLGAVRKAEKYHVNRTYKKKAG